MVVHSSVPTRARRLGTAVLLAAVMLATSPTWVWGRVPTAEAAEIGFTRKTILTKSTPGANLFTNPTTLALGPDGKLYVGQQDGRIHILTLNAARSVTSIKVVHTIYNTPNKNADGSAVEWLKGRQLLGIAFDPASTAAQPVLYVTHSDPRIGENNTDWALSIDTHSGTVTKLTGPDFDAWGARTDLITGLPRSRENHGINGLDWGPDGWLYVAQGGNTNNGAKSEFFSNLPEYYLSAAVLRANVKGASSSFPIDVRGITSKSKEKPGIFEVYATGYRNAYDLAWHSNGKLYLNDNGGNQGLGTYPGPSDGCSGHQAVDPGNELDHLHLVTKGAYGGHPNPARGECVPEGGSSYTAPLVKYANGYSTNGIVEYKAAAFGGAMKGNLLAATWGGDNNIRRIVLGSGGATVRANQDLGTFVRADASSRSVAPAVAVENLGAFNQPLDVEADAQGTVYVAEHGGDAITLLLPNQHSEPCPAPGSDPRTTDSDGDGYKDQDERDNRTNPCSKSSYPADFDKDKVSDRNDPDDDNDRRTDGSDQLFFDWYNGTKTPTPLHFGWNPGDPVLGKVSKSGFTGVQIATRGRRWVATNIKVGAAGGFLALSTTGGTNQGASNSQENALQTGLEARTPFRIMTRVTQPFLGKTPSGRQAGGLFLGLDQDNYVKLVVTANNGTGRPGVQFATETGGTFVANPTGNNPRLALPGPDNVDLRITGNPATRSLTASYRVDSTSSAAWRTIGTVSAARYPALGRFFRNGLPAGILTTNAGTTRQLAFGFDSFSIDHPGRRIVRVNAGGGSYVDPVGPRWAADTGSSGGAVHATEAPIAKTDADKLYQTERWGDYGYKFAVPNGTYTVTLKFAEIWWTSPGQRVFDVTIEGRTVLDDFDILRYVPKNTALDRSFTVVVRDGAVNIGLKGTVDKGKLSAIEIIEAP